MSLTFLVPTHREDRPLARCLNSIQHQMQPKDEVIVIGDTHDGPLPYVKLLVGSYGPYFTYLPFDAGHHCYGHCQLNHGISLAQGDYLHVNDDDDVWTVGAADKMRLAVAEEPDRPHLFRFQSYVGGMIFWAAKGMVERNYIGGHCLVTPNGPKVGTWDCAYTGDFDYIRTTLDLHGGNESAVWHEDVIAVARPC